MIVLISGASHSGKTLLAQRLLERHHYPYLSIDHLKMGLIRSGHSHLTPSSSQAELTSYLWPITREIIKTNIENAQNLIVEGCYIPFDYYNDFTIEELTHIRYVCLVLSDAYILSNYTKIIDHASTIEKRLDDSYCTTEMLLESNRFYLNGCKEHNLNYVLIDHLYSVDLEL